MKINQNLFEYSNVITGGFAIISAHDHSDADELLKKHIKKLIIRIGLSIKK